MATPKANDKNKEVIEDILSDAAEAAPTPPVVEEASEPKIDLNTFLRLRQVFDIAFFSGVLGSYGKYPRTTTEWDALLSAKF